MPALLMPHAHILSYRGDISLLGLPTLSWVLPAVTCLPIQHGHVPTCLSPGRLRGHAAPGRALPIRSAPRACSPPGVLTLKSSRSAVPAPDQLLTQVGCIPQPAAMPATDTTRAAVCYCQLLRFPWRDCALRSALLEPPALELEAHLNFLLAHCASPMFSWLSPGAFTIQTTVNKNREWFTGQLRVRCGREEGRTECSEATGCGGCEKGVQSIDDNQEKVPASGRMAKTSDGVVQAGLTMRQLNTRAEAPTGLAGSVE